VEKGKESEEGERKEKEKKKKKKKKAGKEKEHSLIFTCIDATDRHICPAAILTRIILSYELRITLDNSIIRATVCIT